MQITPDSLQEALSTLGELLQARGQTYDLALIGGGALILAGLLQRESTKDLDIVARIEGDAWIHAEPLPAPLAEAVMDVAAALDLRDDWLNPGPTSMLDLGLPPGFAGRCSVQRFGPLTIRFASRVDQIAFKLFAAADHWPDRSKHLQDLIALSPTEGELLSAARWCRSHDPSEGFCGVQLAPVLSCFGLEAPDDE